MHKQKGFSLIEMMVAVAIFTIIMGTAFQLLNVSQQRYKIESEYLNSFQSARLAVDQMSRDIHSAGYPPANAFTVLAGTNRPDRVALPFAWPAPGYPGTPCTVGAGCTTPSDFDLIVETSLDPQNTATVQWIRYKLVGTTMFRGVASKAAGGDPVAATDAALFPYVENVMNNASAAQMNQLKVFYPAMFPGNAAIPIFRYTFDAGATAQPANIRQVNISLIVQAPQRDLKNNQLRAVTLTGLVRTMTPTQ